VIAWVLAACGAAPPGADSPDADPWTDPEPPALADDNDDPAIFEATLTAQAATWSPAPDLDVEGLAYGGSVPGPVVRVPLGTRVVVHFENDLPAGFDTTVHWHGIEGNNSSDGTAVTQHAVAPGLDFTYDFVVTRPGLYWYHPHVRGAQGVFEGLYGVLVVDDPDEVALRDLGVLPRDERVIVLSDLSEVGGVPWSVEVDNPMEVMNGTEGQHLLVNGREDPVFEVAANEPVRLRIVNTSITRFWRLAVPGHTLFRIGGQGGLLDEVRVEGGELAGLDLGFARGEVLLAPAERADVVLVPQGEPGDRLELRWEDYARGRHGMWMEGDTMVMGDVLDDGQRPGETVATFELFAGDGAPWDLDEGDPVLGAVGRAVGALPEGNDVVLSGDDAMTFDEDMAMWQDGEGVWQMSMTLLVDGAEWRDDMMGGPEQPEAPTAVHARLGDVLLWELRNDSHMAHPLHIHGFSFQPIEYVQRDEEGAELATWAWDYDEYLDTILLPGDASVVVRMALADPVGDGSAAGRWMRHCHILQHGENGMMSELVVEP
jgi:FtsP/CotA-like multicopper oxidase with cupredoxin domain